MLRTVFMAFCVLFFIGCQDDKASKEVLREFKTGDKIELNGVYGGKLTLLRKDGGFVIDGDENKTILFDIFGTFCVPCKKEAPALSDLQVKYSKDMVIIALTHFEEVSDVYVVDNFLKPYGAYYFISNSSLNASIVDTVLKDIEYKPVLQLPFKVVLKDGEYQNLSDYWNKGEKSNFYLGAIPTTLIEDDLKNLILK